jgi:hypothetical protein
MTTQTFVSERPLEETSHSPAHRTAVSTKQLWAGRIISGLTAAFMLMDGVMKLIKPAPVLEATMRLGYPESAIAWIGIVLTAFTVLYVIPRTSKFGAILLTGYLGGAVASQVRIGAGWFPVLFPMVFCVLVWGGLWLRDGRLRDLVPIAGEPSVAARKR